MTDELAFKVFDATMTASSSLACRVKEKTDTRALIIELQHLELSLSQDSPYPITYRRINIDECITDLIIEEALVVDTKTISNINDNEVGQVRNDLKVTQKENALILNSKHSKLDWHKITLKLPTLN